MFVLSGVLMIIGGSVLVGWSRLATAEALRADPLASGIGATGARTLHTVFGLAAMVAGVGLIGMGLSV